MVDDSIWALELFIFLIQPRTENESSSDPDLIQS